MNESAPLKVAPLDGTHFAKLPATTTHDRAPAGPRSHPWRFFVEKRVFGGAPLVELHDQAWFPKLLRDYVTDGLQAILNFVRIYEPIVPRLNYAIRAAKTPALVDLCSGGGGPWLWLSRSLQRAGELPATVCLTDKYPNIAAFEELQRKTQGQVTFHAESVNAARLPAKLSGFRTIFTSFHHFQPQQALAILQDAVDARDGIGVFEAARRHPSTILCTVLMFLGGFLAAPFIRPFRLSRYFWTYVIPAIPLVLFFDGVISCLRAYSQEELAGLVSAVRADDYVWEIGEQRGGFARITYLVGYPKSVVHQITPAPIA